MTNSYNQEVEFAQKEKPLHIQYEQNIMAKHTLKSSSASETVLEGNHSIFGWARYMYSHVYSTVYLEQHLFFGL